MMLDELGDFLQTAGVAVQGTDLFLGSRPDDPDRVLVLYEYPGGAPEYVQDSPSPNWERAQLQVVARAKEYSDARLLAQQAWDLLAAVVNVDLSGIHYLSIKPYSSPAAMGRDTNDRVLIFFNATVEKEVTLAPVS